MMHCCPYGEGRRSTLEIGEFEITARHQLVNRPYSYPRHITRFESLSHRGSQLYNSLNQLSSCPIPITKKSTEAEKTLGQKFSDYRISRQLNLPSLYCNLSLPMR